MAEPPVHQLQMKVASRFDHLEEVVERTQAFMERVTDDEDLAYRVVLLMSEAVANAMEHGNGYDAGKHVRIALSATPSRVELLVRDEGAGFEPKAVANPLAADHLLDDGGRGLFLMEEYADEARWEDHGSVLRLIFLRNP